MKRVPNQSAWVRKDMSAAAAADGGDHEATLSKGGECHVEMESQT
jgi:hypothetical protein